MFIGHYGVAHAARAVAPGLNPGLLFLATQAPDIVWATLNLLGVERTTIDPAFADTAAPLAYRHPYSHSLPAILAQGALVAAGAGLVDRGAGGGGRKTALVLGATVCSHWALDLPVHRADLPLWGDAHKVGLGLARWPRLAYTAEALLLVGGVALRWRVAPPRAGRDVAANGAFTLGLLLFGGAITFGTPGRPGRGALLSMLASYGAFAGVASCLGRRAF